MLEAILLHFFQFEDVKILIRKSESIKIDFRWKRDRDGNK